MPKLLEPVCFLLWDPAEINRYSGDALECAKLAPRNLVGGSGLDITPQNMEEMIETLLGLGIEKRKIYVFPGDENQINPKAGGAFIPGYVAGSTIPENLGFRQAEAKGFVEKIYGKKNVEWIFYVPQGGKVFERAKCIKLSPEQIIRQFDYGTTVGNFDWYYLEGGSGAEEPLSLNLVLRCYEISKERGKNFITGGGIRTFEQAKERYDHGISIVKSNILLEPQGYLVVRKVLNELYTTSEVKFA
jgi:heptaprenylglyceryl phosphate synthase